MKKSRGGRGEGRRGEEGGRSEKEERGKESGVKAEEERQSGS